MSNNKIIITGIGILSSNAKGKEDYWTALKEGRNGSKEIDLFDTQQFPINVGGQVSDFEPQKYMGKKGLRSLDRSTKMLVSASKMAVEDCGLEITDDNTDQIGVSVGTTLGSVKSISDFDEATLKEGPRYTNPAHFPNTVINSSASQVSIWNNIQGFNATISTGFTASIDAMRYAYDFINRDRVKVVFAGGVEEMCLQTFYGFYALKFLSGSIEGDKYINAPFDKRRNGITFGEGACLLAIEDYDHAKKREANMMAEILGFGYWFDPYRINKYNPSGVGVKKAICNALDSAGMDIGEVDCIFANANSTKAADKIESHAIREVFGRYADKIPVSATKSMLGECFSVSGAFSVAAAVGAIVNGFIPPTIGLKEVCSDCDLDYIPGNHGRKLNLKNALIVSFGPNGSCSCVIVGRVSE